MRRRLAGWAVLAAAVVLILLAAAGLLRISGTYAVFSDRETAQVSIAVDTVEPPTDLTCRFLGFLQAELLWAPSASEGVEGYRVYHKGPCPPDADFHLLVEVPGAASTSYDGLRPSFLRHRYFVTAFADSWESGASNTVDVHCRPRLSHFPGPCCLRGENHHSQRTIELNWGGVWGAVSYAVLRGTESGGPYELLATTGAAAYTDTAVNDGVTYYYVVLALDDAGNESDPSAEVAVPDVAPTPTPTATFVPTPMWTPTATPSPEPPATAQPTATLTSTPTPGSIPTWEPSPTSTVTPESASTLEPTATPIATSSATPTVAATPEAGL